VGKTTLTFSANVNILSISATLPACWYHAKRKISGKYVHGNYSRCFTRTQKNQLIDLMQDENVELKLKFGLHN
jgi:hypothetical protein